MNQFSSEEVFKLFESAVFHQKIQVIQIVETQPEDTSADPQALER